jgi:hypothetical protein
MLPRLRAAGLRGSLLPRLELSATLFPRRRNRGRRNRVVLPRLRLGRLLLLPARVKYGCMLPANDPGLPVSHSAPATREARSSCHQLRFSDSREWCLVIEEDDPRIHGVRWSRKRD